MMNKKFFLLSLLVAASLATGVAFYSCNGNDTNPADEGSKAAKELCDCFSSAGTDVAKEACFDEFERKYGKYENDKAFQDAYNNGFEACTAITQEWYLGYLGKIAALDFCDFFTNTPEAADPTVGMGLMISEGYYTKYTELFYKEAFMNTVLTELLATCPSVPDWYYCSFGMIDRCPDNREALGIQVAEELCNCFANASNENEQTGCLEGLMQYFSLMKDPEFSQAFFGKVGENCPDALALIQALMQSGGSE